MLWKQKTFALVSAAVTAGLGLVLAANAAEVGRSNAETQVGGVQMKPYKNAKWNFALEIPARWNVAPPVSSNSPSELIRFVSNENGVHRVIVFRDPYDPTVSPEVHVAQIQTGLAQQNFAHFVTGETRIGSRAVRTLDFDRPRADGKTWSCREYFIIDGTLNYTLGFGTTDRKAMFGVYDRMAKSFTFGIAPG
jgi:hypothetical protein